MNAGRGDDSPLVSNHNRQALRHDDFVTRKHIFARERLRTDTNTFIFHCLFLHNRCSQTSPMMNNGASLKQVPQSRTFYSIALRCIGQSLESMELKSVEVKTHGDSYIIQAWNKGTSTSMDLERHCSLEDLRKLDIEGKEKRKALPGLPNLLSLSQVLRLAGNYVDRMRGRLISVSWQDQSDKI